MSRTQALAALSARAAAVLAAIRCAAAALCLLAPVAHAGTLNLAVLRQDGRPLAGAVVTVRSLDGAAKPAAPVHAVMDQVDQMFRPDVLVIPVGSTVAFPNSDTTRHEVYSFSPAHPFQLPLYRGKPYPPEHFDKIGLVTLGCNIHDFMIAYIVVTDASFYGRTDASGHWSAADVPAGRYRIEVWHPRLASGTGNPSRALSIGAGEPTRLDIRLDQPLRPPMLHGHMSSWDTY